jgi:RNA polymerase sigma factor (sigma-70 family)
VDWHEHLLSGLCDHELLSSEEERSLSIAVQAGARAQQGLSDSDSDPLQVNELIRRGVEARNRFVSCNQRLVLKIARQYADNQDDVLDLLQEGNIALMRAVDKYDGRKGFRFSTYASTWVSAYIAIHASEDRFSVRIPHKVSSKVRRAAAQVTLDNSTRSPSNEDIASEAGVSTALVQQVRRCLTVLSLDQSLTDDSITALVDVVQDLSAEDPCEEVLLSDDRARLHAAIRRLPELERSVVSLLHGIRDERCYSKSEVARIVGASIKQVSEAEETALNSLRALCGPV